LTKAQQAKVSDSVFAAPEYDPENPIDPGDPIFKQQRSQFVKN